jgi:hypothetical protein
MNKTFAILFALILSACNDEPAVLTLEAPSPEQELHQSEEGLTLSLVEASYTKSPAFIQTTIRNEGSQNFGYGVITILK